MRSKLSRARARISGRYALVTALVLVLGVPAAAMATGEGRSLLGGDRNPRSGDYNDETQIIADNSTYGTRQSNKRDGDGGGAIYGCRSAMGHEPCVRANNLKGGRAFEFETRGKEAGNIQVGDDSGVPFTTNATGTVKNLSADKVDGVDSTQLVPKVDVLFAAVKADGTLAANRGATAAAIADAAGNTYAVTFSRDVSGCSLTASPVGDATTYAIGVAANPDNKNQVLVDEGGTTATDRAAFHLQVIC